METPIPQQQKQIQFISYMSNYSINTSRRIVHVDAQGVPHEIGKVVYCDHNATPHTVWPCKAHLTNVYIVKLSTSGQGTDVAYQYSVDINTMQPNITLIPGVVYSIKGDIEVYREQVLEKIIKDCYFFEETTNTSLDQADDPFSPVSGNDAYIYGNRIATVYNTNNNPTGETYTVDYTKYTKWIANSNINDTGRMELQLGWWDAQVGYAQNGYIFDPNYVTPLIFKRANIEQEIKFSKIQSNNVSNSNLYNDSLSITDDEQIKFWPKLHKYVSDNVAVDEWETYEEIELTTNNFTYDTNVFNIYQDQSDSSWVIEPLTFSNQPSTITISYGGITKQWNIAVATDSRFMLVMNGNNPVPDPLEITTATDISIRESTDDGITWTTWGSNDYSNRVYSFTSDNSSIVSTSGTTLTPNPNKSGQSTTISVIIEGQAVSTFTVQVGTIVTYYKAGPLVNGTINSSYVNELQSTNTVTWVSPVQGDNFGIQFFIDGSGNTVREIYCDGISTAPFYGNYSGGMIVISYTSGSATSINIPIYTDNTKTTLLGSITLNKV